jgi:hypothetical protein
MLPWDGGESSWGVGNDTVSNVYRLVDGWYLKDVPVHAWNMV